MASSDGPAPSTWAAPRASFPTTLPFPAYRRRPPASGPRESYPPLPRGHSHNEPIPFDSPPPPRHRSFFRPPRVPLSGFHSPCSFPCPPFVVCRPIPLSHRLIVPSPVKTSRTCGICTLTSWPAPFSRRVFQRRSYPSQVAPATFLPPPPDTAATTPPHQFPTNVPDNVF